jgi:DNA-directed RNA polymerase specialized sigma24 family protein
MNATIAPDYESLIESYYQPLFRFAVCLCGNLESALELTQHTFYLAVERREPLQEAAKARQWLFTILFSEFIQKRRLKNQLRALCQCKAATIAHNSTASKPSSRKRL